jgi:hypothetical protein
MRIVGSRKDRPLQEHACGALLIEGARFNETIAKLAKSTFIPKGVYRFKSHEEANRHQQDCLVRGMGRLAAQRAAERG